MPRKSRHIFTDDQLTYLSINRTTKKRTLTNNFNSKFKTNLDYDSVKGAIYSRGWGSGKTKKPAVIYTPDYISVMKQNGKAPRTQVLKILKTKNGRDDLSVHDVRRKMSSMGLKTRTRRDPITYSKTERAFVRTNSTLSKANLLIAFHKKFNRPEITEDNLKSLRLRNGWLTGRNGSFKTGDKPWNTGKKIGSHPNSAKTQFKKGHTPSNAKPVGYERIDNEGYILILTDKENPWTGAPRWFRHKHREEWEKVNGPIPDDYDLKCWGDKQNTDPQNWFLFSKSDRAVLNRWHPNFDELKTREEKEVILNIVELRRKSYSLMKLQSGQANNANNHGTAH